MNKPYIQKAYEKFAMMVFSIVSHFDLGIEGSDYELGMMVADDMNGGGIYLVLIDEHSNCTPMAKLLSNQDCESCEPDFDTLERMTKLFWGTISTEERRTKEDFNKSLKMSEFLEWY